MVSTSHGTDVLGSGTDVLAAECTAFVVFDDVRAPRGVRFRGSQQYTH
jgi:hypothetical protein